ncbi:expressed unknown protein [Seminavis robusta]|uniref:Uncharacterized protein n=1 Tax=Seminavis robusta TaxID=568900 RepID=A0A9N8DBK5_9STRA|nr:expressed unknown protein [Seminavis robusta]|eukprot:Sro20_g014280.1 n/a (237) ;mRNA; f:130925-131635
MVTWDEEETDAPSQTPTTSELTEAPTTEPTVEPTAEPTLTPTTLEPTIEPTTLAPTIKPTLKPISSAPTVAPSATPTSATPVQTSSPTKRGLPAPFQCGLCPDYRFPGAHEKIFANGAISATCLELDVMLTSTEENEECIELMDQIGYEIDVWSFCECPGIDPPGLCELCPGVSKAEVPQNKMVDGLFCSEWAHYAENALDDAYCANLQQRVGTAGTCCPYHYGLQTLQVYAKKNP